MKVLILGDGLLGSELHTQTGWDVASRKLGNLNIDNHKGLDKLIKKYDIVVNCVAHTQSYSLNQNIHRDINYRFAEHAILMLFAIIFGHLGLVYAKNLKDDMKKFKKNFLYFGLSFVLIFISISMNMFRNALHKPHPFPHKEVWDVRTSGDTVQKMASIIIKLINKNSQ